jgi:hypothetical protein
MSDEKNTSLDDFLWGALDKYRPDAKKREAGILVELDPSGDYPVARVVRVAGKLPTFRLAHATGDNPHWEKAFERALRPWRVAKDEAKDKAKAKPDEEDAARDNEIGAMYLEALRETFASVGIVDWFNIPRPFSKEAALALTSENPEVYDKLLGAAQDRRNFRIDPPSNPDADAKNS